MKRGNTALKRGVGLASAFALAIAGAVVAAPAASAAPADISTSITQLRTQPTADVKLLNADGSLVSTGTDFTTAQSNTAYGNTGAANTAPTGQVPTLGIGSAQSAASVQVLIPASAAILAGADPAIEAGDTFTVKLNNGATWSNASATISKNRVVSTTLAGIAGYEDNTTVLGKSKATAATLDTTDPALSSTGLSTTTNTDGDVLTVKFNQTSPVPSAALANGAYLVTISGIKLNVSAAAIAGPVTATVNSLGTTIAYVSPFELRIGADAGYPANSKDPIALPAVTVVETSNKAFQTGQAIGVSAVDENRAVSTTAPSLGVAADAKATPSSKLALGAGTAGAAVAVTATAPVTTIGAANDDLRESFTVTGLNFSGLKAGADLKIRLDTPKSNVPGAGQSAWSQTANQASTGVVLTVKQTSSEPRLAGSNRYATAQKVAAALVKEGEGVNVILANGTTLKNGADALSANFLAGAEGDAPILLTDSSDTLPAATVDALKYLFKDSAGSSSTVNIFVLGKVDSVSEKAAAQAETTVKDAVNPAVSKVNVVRVAGDNRYETSAAAAVQANKDDSAAVQSYDLGSGSLKTAFLASGAVNADALAAGGFSAGAGIPVLLADGDAVNTKVTDAISSLGIKQLVVLGGADRVSDKAIDTLKADFGVTNVVRIAGSGTLGRYNTAALLNTFAFGTDADQLNIGWPTGGSAVYLANAQSGAASGFADALTVGPLAGANKSVVLTTPQNVLPDLAKQFLITNNTHLTGVTALGQSDRIAASVITAAQLAIK